MRWLVLALLSATAFLAQPCQSQSPERPQIEAAQVLSPDPSDSSPTPSTVGLLFGSEIARHDNTALILERGFPQVADAPGRVAVFARNGQGKWVRSGTLDAPRGQERFGRSMAIFNDFALIETNTHAFLYRRVQGQWKLIQRLAPQAGYGFTDCTIWNNWAFIGASSNPPAAGNPGGVHVYEITAAGTLRGVQTLRSYSGDPFDRFGEQVVISSGRVLVSASNDRNGRGAAYVFELSGSLFTKRQKLIAINGATTDRFATAVGISGDWVAIGAPNPNSTAGAIYVFRRINGTWLQQDTLSAADATHGALPSLRNFGGRLMISGNWLVATGETFHLDAPLSTPIVYKRDDTTFTPRADAAAMFSNFDIHLSNGILFAGHPFEPDCLFSRCAGSVKVYDLENAVP